MTSAVRPTGIENILGEEELIVSKTDLKGRITYANDIFIRMAKYSWKELVGAPHSLVRHPDMPRCVFRLLWDTLQAKQEIFAYVVNLDGGTVPATANWPLIIGVMFGPLALVRALHWIIRGRLP